MLTGLNTVFINDQDTLTAQIYTITNDYDWTLPTNDANTIDTTTIMRGSDVIVQYSRQETVALSGGQGGNKFEIQQTHREQSTDGSTSSTFSVNSGPSDDDVRLGAPIGSTGTFSMAGFQQDVVAPTFTGASPSPRGIPVLINSQGGYDPVHVRDDGHTSPASLAFTRTEFRDLFPEAPDARADSADVFQAIFGDDPVSRLFTTVVLGHEDQRAANINIRESEEQAAREPGQNLQLTVSLGSVPSTPASFTPSATSVLNDAINFATNHNLNPDDTVVYHKGEDNESIGLTDGQIYYVQVVSATAIQLSESAGGPPVSLTSPATTASAVDRLAPVGNVVKLTSAAYATDIVVNAGDGNDTINIENGVQTTSNHTLDIAGGGGDDTTYIDFNGVSIIDRGNLGQTVSNVAFSRDDADSGVAGRNPLTPGTYFVETRWNGAEWQFRLADAVGDPVAVADLGDTGGLGLLANWQNISLLPVVELPDADSALVSRFDSHRGFVIDFSSQYLATDDSIVGATRLELSASPTNQVNGLFVAKRGVLAQTITDVTYAADELDPTRLTPGTHYVQTRWNGTDWQFRVLNNDTNTAIELVDLDDATGTTFTNDWQNIRKVTAAADGSRSFSSGTGLIIEFAGEYETGSGIAGESTELLLGVPAAQLSLTFDGGTQTAAGVGDTLRIAGDGDATGALYQPSSTLPGGGTVTVSGNTLAFSGVEPLIVHGLPDFKMLTPNSAATLTIDSEQLANTTRQALQLHTLTVEGQVTWTQKKQFVPETPALDPRELGRAIAISSDGTTMVVGAKAKVPGSAAGNLTDGMVLVYKWVSGAWSERARLQPGDLRLNDKFGVDFGASVAIDGNRLIVGSPGDAPADATGSNYGTVYVFERGGVDAPWIQTQKLLAEDAAANRYFGASVAIRGTKILVGAPGTDGSNSGEAVYLFELNAGNWKQTDKETGSGDFGRSVALAGSFGVVGAPAADNARVYYTSTKSLGATLVPSDAQSGERFGAAVAAHASSGVSRIVVGAPLWNGPADYAYAGDAAHAQQGRAFIFDLVGSSWVRVARLTAAAGLPRAEAAGEARTHDRFGTSVALDNKYVVVGAPGHDKGSAIGTGAAYVFYELENGTTGANRSSWTRSSGSSGSGRLEESLAAKNDNFGQAVAVWHDPSTGAGRTMVGIPGFNEATGLQRADLGAVRTFTTTGVSPTGSPYTADYPDPTSYELWAEKLTEGSGANQFGNKTLYDAATRLLFVAAPNQSTVYAYANEGLHWRPLYTLTGGSGFGTDMALDGNRLIIGAPGANEAYIYEKVGGVWTQVDTDGNSSNGLTPLSGTGGFGTSVAIRGNRVVIGEPEADVGYKTGSNNGNFVDLSDPGDAVVFKYNSGRWTRERRLMPSDGNLPTRGQERSTVNVSGSGKLSFWPDLFSGTEYIILLGDRTDCSDSWLSGNQLSSARVGPSTRAVFKDTDSLIFSDWGSVDIRNESSSYYHIEFVENRNNRTVSHRCYGHGHIQSGGFREHHHHLSRWPNPAEPKLVQRRHRMHFRRKTGRLRRGGGQEVQVDHDRRAEQRPQRQYQV